MWFMTYRKNPQQRLNGNSMFSSSDQFWMKHAITLAQQAGQNNEVPIAAVLISEEKIIGQGWNQTIAQCDPTAHAEIIALREAAKNQGNYRLLNTTLYVTIEPCVMCVGAMLHARIKRLVYGALEPRTGAVASQFHLLDTRQLNHHIVWEGGCEAQICSKLMQEFFQARRGLSTNKTVEIIEF